MGGSDQWGNIVTGTELIRRKISDGHAYAFTCPLIKKADGTKFGKTETGNIWLDAEKTSPYQFYQFWLNATDVDAEDWIKIFTFLSEEEITALIQEHSTDSSQRVLQKKLASELTRFVHGEEQLTKALETTERLFSSGSGSVADLNEDDLQAIEGIIKVSVPFKAVEAEPDVVSLLAEYSIFTSKGEARKMIQNGGLSINKTKVTDAGMKINRELLLRKKYLLVQKGKKNYYLVTAE